MYRDDWLTGQIRRAVEALARLARGERVADEDVDAALREAVGLDLPTIDALPAEALRGLLVHGDPRTGERLAAVAGLLDALARPGDGRAEKAQALRAQSSAPDR